MAGEPLSESYCLERAAEARMRAEAMKDTEARQTMLNAAHMWELMAKRRRAPEHNPYMGHECAPATDDTPSEKA
jgi:hypothetical protein